MNLNKYIPGHLKPSLSEKIHHRRFRPSEFKIAASPSDIIVGILIGMLALWLTYKSLLCLPAAILFVPFYLRIKEQDRFFENGKRMREEFKNLMSLLYSLTSAGSAPEASFRSALKSMESSPERFPIMIPVLRRLCIKLDMNIPLDKAVAELLSAGDDEDIRDFAEIVRVSSRSGGDLPKIIERTSSAIAMKMDMSDEIDTLLAGKSAELKVMTIIPACILIYMNISSPDYMNIIYSCAAGRFIMSIALTVYIAAYYIGRKIIHISV